MAKATDLRKHFEAILGREISADLPDEEVVLRTDVATYSLLLDGKVTSRNIGTTGESTQACRSARLLDVGGVARTGSDGTTTFVLGDFFCDKAFFNLARPINFVATPIGRRPVFLTATRSLTTAQDVQIRVLTWTASGSPAANISFDWRCRVQYSLAGVD